jgi:putative ABC transport system permease protein
MMVSEGGRLAVVGVVLGSVVALAGARLIRGLLFEVSATDPLTFAAVAAALLGVALVASYLPARRATRVDPMVALRGE